MSHRIINQDYSRGIRRSSEVFRVLNEGDWTRLYYSRRGSLSASDELPVMCVAGNQRCHRHKHGSNFVRMNLKHRVTAIQKLSCDIFFLVPSFPR